MLCSLVVDRPWVHFDAIVVDMHLAFITTLLTFDAWAEGYST